MADIQLYLFEGGQESSQIDDRLVSEKIDQDLMFRAVQRELTNKRQGTVSTKTRSEVAGTGRKPWRQKGTGRARAGSFKSPLWRGGGVIFGPKPKTYHHAMPRKMRRKALRIALSTRFQDGNMSLVDRLVFDAPKTKEGIKFLERIEHTEKTLIVCAQDENQMAVRKSFSNLSNALLLPTAMLTVYNILAHDKLVLTQEAVAEIAERVF